MTPSCYAQRFFFAEALSDLEGSVAEVTSSSRKISSLFLENAPWVTLNQWVHFQAHKITLVKIVSRMFEAQLCLRCRL